MILPRIITICKHTLALVTLLAIWRQNNSWQLGSGGRTLKRDTSCSIQVSISCVLMLPLWSISIASSKSNATLSGTVSPSLAIPAIICVLDSSVGGAWPDATTLGVLDSAANNRLAAPSFSCRFSLLNVKNLRNATYMAARSSGTSSHGLHAVVEVSHGSQVCRTDILYPFAHFAQSVPAKPLVHFVNTSSLGDDSFAGSVGCGCSI